MSSPLQEKLSSGKKVITAEITPPKGAGIKKLLKNAELLKPHVDAINVTDCQRALVKMSSLATCKILLDAGIDPVFQLTCRDRNTIALQSDLMGASALGIRNLLCLTGDPVKVGDNPNAKSVFEVESVRLLEIVKKLQSGTDNEGIKMNAATKFFVGAVVNPSAQLMAGQLGRMEKKVAAGARFFQTQANYELSDFKAFLKDAKAFDTKILAGILILHSHDIAKYIHANIPGIRIPDAILKRFESATTAGETTGIEIAAELMVGLDDVVDGFHVMSVREEELIPRVLELYHEKRQLKAHATL